MGQKKQTLTFLQNRHTTEVLSHLAESEINFLRAPEGHKEVYRTAERSGCEVAYFVEEKCKKYPNTIVIMENSLGWERLNETSRRRAKGYPSEKILSNTPEILTKYKTLFRPLKSDCTKIHNTRMGRYLLEMGAEAILGARGNNISSNFIPPHFFKSRNGTRGDSYHHFIKSTYRVNQKREYLTLLRAVDFMKKNPKSDVIIVFGAFHLFDVRDCIKEMKNINIVFKNFYFPQENLQKIHAILRKEISVLYPTTNCTMLHEFSKKYGFEKRDPTNAERAETKNTQTFPNSKDSTRKGPIFPEEPKKKDYLKDYLKDFLPDNLQDAFWEAGSSAIQSGILTFVDDGLEYYKNSLQYYDGKISPLYKECISLAYNVVLAYSRRNTLFNNAPLGYTFLVMTIISLVKLFLQHMYKNKNYPKTAVSLLSCMATAVSSATAFYTSDSSTKQYIGLFLINLGGSFAGQKAVRFVTNWAGFWERPKQPKPEIKQPKPEIQPRTKKRRKKKRRRNKGHVRGKAHTS